MVVSVKITKPIGLLSNISPLGLWLPLSCLDFCGSEFWGQEFRSQVLKDIFVETSNLFCFILVGEVSCFY